MSAPTLLVGIGGTGSGIVQRVYELATEEQRKNIGFVVFDTDVNELRTIEEKTPQIKTVQTSSRMTVGEYLEVDEYSKNTWFPVNKILNSKALTEGAGQVRAISRLALNTTIKQGKMTPIDEAIESLYELNGQKTVQAPRVIITGSLCGGTGSGLVLPISLYIRNFMNTKLQQGSAIIRGFFILPDVYDGVIKTQSERNNLRSNAYAAIREIDAFMMKDDGSLPEQYDLHFYAPRAGSKQPEEYTGRPMDFCFLFDAQNINGQKLKSFASYKEHAAHCIYGMAIAPTSKRSNSSEDNVIREIVFAGGRNRYAGAGSAILRYPTDDVKKYLALCWTKDSISSEWLAVDSLYYKVLKDNARARRSGGNAKKIDRGKHYIEIIDAMVHDRENGFAGEIRDAVMQHDENGYGEKGSNWDKYIEELQEYLNKRIDQQKEYQEDVINDLSLKAADVMDNPIASSFQAWYDAILTYQNATYKDTETLVRNIVYGLFKDTKDYTETDDTFRMEYWLRSERQSGTFAHPNAARYFLYNLLDSLKSHEIEQRTIVDNANDYWRNFEKNAFKFETGSGKNSDGTTMSSQEGYYDAHHLNSDSLIDKVLHRTDINDAQAALKGQFNTYRAHIDEYWEAYVQAEVYKAGAAYVEAILEAFHGFYNILDKTIKGLGVQIKKLTEKYEYRPGEALRYVCANKDCLEGLGKEVVNLNSGLTTPAELNRKIFSSMKVFALAEQKIDEESYFMDTFNSSIVGYFESEVMSQYRSVVDMDIITAMEKEALFVDPKENFDTKGQQLYAAKMIDEMEMLAKPFIESPVGKEPRIIPSCAYSPDLSDPVKADFPGRKGFVRKYLADRGGEAHPSIDKNMILFYQAVYDIRANELSKFAPARNEETYSSPDGDYYKAYYELINQINPATVKSKVITPHIDKWWHVIDKLPDLDEKSQEMQEKRIYKAFFWGILDRYVTLRTESQDKNVYYLDQNKFRTTGNEEVQQKLAHDTIQLEDSIIVSNGTPCDHVYEILDAFTIYPALVTAVLGQAKRKTDIDLYDKKKLHNSYLYDCISNFEIQEFSLGTANNEYRERLVDVLNEVKQEDLVIENGMDKDIDDILELLEKLSGDKRSIFEVPIIMKASVPAEMYYEKKVKTMMSGMLDIIKEYIHRFCSEKEYYAEYAALLSSQYGLFLKNISREKEDFPVRDIFHDSLFIYVSGAIQGELEELGLRNKAKLIENVTNKLSRIVM
jgi:hypothetical protein